MMDLHEQILERTYSRPERSIPHLPPVIEGRTYFNKARDRDRAVRSGIASDTIAVDPAPAFHYTRRELLRVHHWEGARCTALRLKRWPGTKMSILNGEDFDALGTVQKCRICKHQFENA